MPRDGQHTCSWGRSSDRNQPTYPQPALTNTAPSDCTPSAVVLTASASGALSTSRLCTATYFGTSAPLVRLECCAGDGARTGALGCQPATSNFASTAHASGALLVPPDDATRYELARDATLAFLARKEFTAFAVLLIPLVLGFGGLWFFLLIGLHSLEVRPHALRPARPRCARAALLDQRNQRRQQHARPSLPQLPPSEPTLTAHRSHLTPHTSHLTPHTSHLTPHTSHLTPHRSPLAAHRSPLTAHRASRCGSPRKSKLTSGRTPPSRS
eukprot:scaffold65863_cov66-Phaeocystis_antarctica.AAC.4